MLSPCIIRHKDKILSIEDYLDKIKAYLIDMINDLKTQGEFKIQLIMKKATVSLKNNYGKCFQYSIAATLILKQIKYQLKRIPFY